jgi:glycosyltransferase involved in cell wall biosynthesis
LVVDSGSTDGTREVAARLGARVIQNAWPGFAKQKNFAAAKAQHDWVLSLDADEALSEALEGEILTLKQQQPRYNGYAMPRLAQYCGKWILHSGWRPDIKVRLYHRDRAEWVGDYVHESVRVRGSVGQLRSHLLHFTCSSLSEHLRTLDRYTTLAAQELAAQGRKPRSARLFLDPPWTFIQSYLLRRGFLDGAQGLSIAWMAALYTYLKYAKARELIGE